MATIQMIEYLARQYPLSDQFRAHFRRALLERNYEKGHTFYQTRDFYSIWFINQGLAKGSYHSQDGAEHITRFWQQGEIMLLHPQKARQFWMTDHIILLEDSVLSSISSVELKAMYHTLAETSKLASKILLEDNRKSDLKSFLSSLPAIRAYAAFTELFPSDRLLLRDIAAFLEITPSTLSEIRRKRP